MVWAFIRVGVQLATGGSGSDALQGLYKSLQVDSGKKISCVDDGGGLIQWQEHNIRLLGYFIIFLDDSYNNICGLNVLF